MVYEVVSLADARHEHFARTLEDFFLRKSAGDVDGFVSLFDVDAVYADATVGWCVAGWNAIRARFAEHMPGWVAAEAVSYTTRVMGDTSGGVAFVTVSPQMLGREIRAVSSVELREGRVVRFVDYWDGRHFGRSRMPALRVADFPAQLGENWVPTQAHGEFEFVVRQLAAALSRGDVDGVAELCSADVTFEDLVLRVRVHGTAALAALLERSVSQLPYGTHAQLRRIVGGGRGGGFEWTNQRCPVPRGITAVMLNKDGLVTEITAMWDGSLVSDAVHDIWAVTATAATPGP
jgi:ketosteroid isomerase-like protein